MIWRKKTVPIVGVTCAYLALFAVTFWILMPILAYILTKHLPFGWITSFSILPHGFRVVLTWLWRARAVAFLLPGTLIQSLIVAKHYALGVPEGIAMVLCFSCCSYAAFEVAKWFGLNAYAASCRPENWRAVLIVGTLAGLINGVVNMAFVFNHFPIDVQLWIVLNLCVGGMIGLMAWLFIMRLALRHIARAVLLPSSGT